MYAVCAFLSAAGLIAQLYLFDWWIDGASQARRKVIYWHRATTRYRQMRADLDFGAELYEMQCQMALTDNYGRFW